MRRARLISKTPENSLYDGRQDKSVNVVNKILPIRMKGSRREIALLEGDIAK